MTAPRTSATERPLRLLVVSSYLPGVGGGELQTALQVETLAARGHQVTVVDIGNNPDAPPAERIQGIPVLRAGAPRWRWAGLMAQLRFCLLLRRQLPSHDLVQFNHLCPELATARWLARWYRKPLVLVVWGSSRPGIGPFGRGWRQALARHAARRVRHVVALGSETRANLIAGGFDQGHIEVIYNGVDMERFRPGPWPDGPPAGLPGNGPLVVSVGRLVPAKGYDLLLAAWQEVAARFPAGTLVLLGDGPLRRELEAERDRRGLQERVLLAGLRRDVPAWLASSDIYVSSSRTEGMSNALLEALAAGLPVVATRVGGAEDVVAHGQNGLLIQRESVAELRDALGTLLADAELRRTMSREARRRAEAGFAIGVIADRYESLFRRVSAAGQPDAAQPARREAP